MPSKIQKGGKIRYRATVMVNGVTRQKLFRDASRATYREAVKWEEETRSALKEAQSQTNIAFLVVGEWINEYLDDGQKRFSAKTFEEKRSAFQRFIQFTDLSQTTPVQEITVTMCRRYLSQQATDRSGYAANKDRKNLATAWAWGMENIEGWPDSPNPFKTVRKYPELREPRYVPPEEDFWKVLEMAKGQDRVMLETFLHLAARRGEVFSLKWSDVDFDNDRVRLWTRKREGGHHEFDWVAMTKDLRSQLRSWWQERIGMKTEDHDHVFVSLTESPFCDEYFGKPFKHRQHFMKRMCDRAGVKAFGFHAIRHLTASILYRKGQPLSVIQSILRHKNPNTTTRYLRSIGLETTREALEEGLTQPAKIIPLKRQSV